MEEWVEMEDKKKRNQVAFLKKEGKRVLAIILATLMTITTIDFGGMQYVSAADENTTNVITALAGLPGEIANQQLAVGSLETAINLPNSLSVTNEEYDLAAIQTVTGGAITVSGSAISMNETYSLTGDRKSVV